MPSRSAALVFALSAALVPLLSVAVSPVRAHDPVTGTPDVTIFVGRGLSDRSVSVAVGGIVRFVNQDDERHRFRSRSGAGFDTGNIDEGESAQVRLGAPGTYAYIDERDDEARAYHGRIVVSGGPKDGGSTTGGSTNGRATGPAPVSGTASAATVAIVDEAFSPATTRVKVGGSVTFENQDGDEHTATSAGAGGIDSGVLGTGASYTKTFAEPGSFAFLCILHPEMRGTIEVVGSAPAGGQAAPPADPAPVKPEPPAPATGDTAVDIVDLAFEPSALSVTTGSTVTWTNTGVAPHTATAEDGSFDSGTLETGGTFAQAFTTPGTFAYLCEIHPDMTGTIEVVDAGAPGAPATQAEPAAPAAPAAPVTAPGDGASAAPSVEAAPTSAIEPERTGADLGSLTGIVVAVTMVSVASALFARLLRGTVKQP